MIVRDLTKPKSEYKGHHCYAVDAICPCRPCYNCHDFSPPNPAHSRKLYSDGFHCASNWYSGCPQPKPEPTHTLNRQKRCVRCGQVIRACNDKKIILENV